MVKPVDRLVANPNRVGKFISSAIVVVIGFIFIIRWLVGILSLVSSSI